MTRVLLSSIFALHGFIHLMGFVKEWNLGPVGKFSGQNKMHFTENTSRIVGALWLITCILLFTATVGYYLQQHWFWIAGITGLLISQTLIIVYWRDAKWGTIVNIILGAIILLAAAHIRFDRMVSKEVQQLVASSDYDHLIISDQEILDQPQIIQQWLRNAHVVGRPMPSVVHLLQNGSMRTDKNSTWMPFEAEQYFSLTPPAFVWNATIHVNKFFDIRGRDKFENGKGNMLIRAASLFSIANSTGAEIDQGTLIRYLAEIVWFPHAAVNDYLDWEQLDDTHARAVMSYGDTTASGIFTFNSEGLPISFEAQRFGEFNGKYSKETWHISIHHYQNFDGILIGSESEVTWKLKEGDFSWLRLAVTNIEYN